MKKIKRIYKFTNNNDYNNYDSNYNILSLGNVNLEFELYLSIQEYQKYINDEIKSIEQLNFLEDNKELWNKIKLTSSNFILNTLLFVNKISNKKIDIEYLSYKYPTFNENEKFLEKIFNYIFDKQHILFNRSNFLKDYSYANIKFIINIENKYIKNFDIGINDNNNSSEVSNNLNEENLKSKNNKNIFENIKIINNLNIEYFFIHFNECFYSVNNDCIFPLDDLLEFLYCLKNKYNTKIIIFYDDITDLYNINYNNYNILEIIKNFFYITDIYFWELKNFEKNIKIFYDLSTEQNINNNLYNNNNKNNILYNNLKLFLNEIIYNSICSKKLNIIFNEYKLIYINEIINKNKNENYSFNFFPYKAMNNFNIKEINNVKKILKENNNLFLSLFISGFLKKICENKLKCKKKFEIDIIYKAYLCGYQLINKVLNLRLKGKKNLQNEDENYYKININEKKIDEFLYDYKIQQYEKNFVLDCLNKNISKQIKQNKNYFHYFFNNDYFNYNKMNKSSSTKILNEKNNKKFNYIKNNNVNKSFIFPMIYTYNTRKSEISESNKDLIYN